MTSTKHRSSAARLSPASLRPPVRPPLHLLGTEPWRAAGELLKSQFMGAPRARGDGHPVVIFPGLASDGRAVAPLREYCRRLGHVALDWGRGFNTGPKVDVDRWLRALADDVKGLLRGHGQAPTLIGWSLGGLYARELAKLPDMPVRQVITIGTPFNGSPDNTHVGWLYRLLNGQRARLAPALRQRLRTPPPVPTTSIYSRSDGVVAWQACRHSGRTPSQVQDIEVQGSHLGMGWNPNVLRIVANSLQHAG
jgi:hypothetical protein